VHAPGWLAALAALATMAAPAPSHAQFGAPVFLSPVGNTATAPQVAVDATGDAVAAWSIFDGTNRFQARARSAAGALGQVHNLSAPGQNALTPDIAMDNAGDAVTVWRRFDQSPTTIRIQARARSAAGVLGPLQTLAGAGSDNVFDPQVAVDADGDGMVVWRHFNPATGDRIQARTRSAAGTLGVTASISVASPQTVGNHRVAVDSDGDAVIVWRASGGSLRDRILLRARSTATGLRPIQTISAAAAGQSEVDPQVAVAAGGAATVVWTRTDGSASRIRARARSAAGALAPVQTLSPANQDASLPQVAIDGNGNAVAVWHAFNGSNARIQARARSAAGVLGPIQTLYTAPAGMGVGAPQIAGAGNGGVVVVWEASNGFSFLIFARTRSAAGALGPLQTLVNATSSRRAVGPRVAMGAGGDAVAVWERFDGSNFRIQATAGP
jgi:hypothetical protein